MMVRAHDYAAAGKELLAYGQRKAIPYVLAGSSLEGMDCQGLCEYLLTLCGVKKSECNLAGSNAHYRACVWTGTPEECKKKFGCVPAGAWLFILQNNGGEPDKYKKDGIGNASHMGVYLGGNVAIHASSSRGKVAESAFYGKSIPNGGWNRVGLPKWVDYGIDIDMEKGENTQNGSASTKPEAAGRRIPAEMKGEQSEPRGEDSLKGSASPKPEAAGRRIPAANEGGGYVAQDNPTAMYDARVVTANGGHLNFRKAPRMGGTDIEDIPCGEILQVFEEVDGDWAKVWWQGTFGYVMREFLQPIGMEEAEKEIEDTFSLFDGETVQVTLPRNIAEALYEALLEAMARG